MNKAAPDHLPQRSHSPSASAASRPWLARLHPALFGMALGLLGLSGAWRRLSKSGVESAGLMADSLLVVALVMLVVLLLLWVAKLVRHRDVLRQEWRHPVQGALLALLPVATLMAVTLVVGLWPHYRGALLPVALLMLAGQAVNAWHVVADLSSGKTPPELVTPALYLPTVSGAFVGAMALHTLSLHGWATLLFGMALGAWGLLEMRVLNRLFAGPLPIALRPTLGIEMAPGAVGSLTMATLWPELPADVLMVALGVASGPVLAVLTRWRYWREVPFNMGFWSFSFPLAAFAGATVHAVRAGSWPVEVAVIAVSLASAVVAFLTFKSVVLTARGNLLPAV